jgi:sugar/nucleoside kinase (ribokinase family)
VQVLVVGHVTLDAYGAESLPGGSAYYAGHAYRALGATVRILTAAGPDFPASALDGLVAEVVPARTTTAFENVYAPDGRRTQRLLAAAPPLAPSAMPAHWRGGPDVLHLAPVAGEVDLRGWVGVVGARFTGIGVQGWVRRFAEDGAVSPAPFPDVDLAGVDAAAVGAEDARAEPDLPDRLAASVPAVAFTHGELGSELRLRGRTLVAGVHLAAVVDPTGAGDVYAAALFFALARGDPPEDAVRLAAAAASIVVEGRAGDALPRVRDAPARAARVPCAWRDG